MNAAALACAPSGRSWDGIDWIAVQRRVRGLQARIVKAVQDGRHNRVAALGVAAGVGHALVTYNPDYEIIKDYVNKRLRVIYKK